MRRDPVAVFLHRAIHVLRSCRWTDDAIGMPRRMRATKTRRLGEAITARLVGAQTIGGRKSPASA